MSALRKCPGSRGTSVVPSAADIVSLPRHVRLVPNIDIARMKRSKETAARWRLFNSNLMIGDAGSQMQIDL
jgi:hypothetical protein